MRTLRLILDNLLAYAAVVMLGLGMGHAGAFGIGHPTMSVMWAGILGAFAAQVIMDARSSALQAPGWPTRIGYYLIGWSFLLGFVAAISIIGSVWPAESESPASPQAEARDILPIVLPGVLALAIAAATGIWWRKILTRAPTEGMRPGFIIGGLSWALYLLARAALWSVALWSPATARHALAGSSMGASVARLQLVVLPLLLVVPWALVHAGLPRPGPTGGGFRRATLTAAIVVSLWALGVGIITGIREPLFGVQFLGVCVTAATWAVAIVWTIRLLNSGDTRLDH